MSLSEPQASFDIGPKSDAFSQLTPQGASDRGAGECGRLWREID